MQPAPSVNSLVQLVFVCFNDLAALESLLTKDKISLGSSSHRKPLESSSNLNQRGKYFPLEKWLQRSPLSWLSKDQLFIILQQQKNPLTCTFTRMRKSCSGKSKKIFKTAFFFFFSPFKAWRGSAVDLLRKAVARPSFPAGGPHQGTWRLPC